MASSGKKSALTKAKVDFSCAYLTALGEADVLFGRGAPVRKREANQSYHELVKAQKHAYNATGKHAVKDEIARTIVEKVALKGGRFVRRVETDEERGSLAIPEHVTDAWVAVSEDFAREKCKQSLRDAAASLKKRPAHTTSTTRRPSPIPEDAARAIEIGSPRRLAQSPYPPAAGGPKNRGLTTLKEKLQTIMQHNAGIVRHDIDLKKTLNQLQIWKKQCQKMEQEHSVSKDFLELKNSIEVSIPIVAFSLKRIQNKGSFYKEGKTINLQF